MVISFRPRKPPKGKHLRGHTSEDAPRVQANIKFQTAQTLPRYDRLLHLSTVETMGLSVLFFLS
jgi:hypothetical protein